MILGGIEFTNFQELTRLPQKAASAFSAAKDLIGANYKALLFVGPQVVKGTNYHFIAEQTLMTKEPEKHIVKLAVNEFNDNYSIAHIERIY